MKPSGEMPERVGERLGSLRANAYVVLWSWDFAFATLALIGLSVAAATDNLPAKNGTGILTLLAAVAAGILAATLTAIQLFVGYLDKYYGRLLEETAGGVRNALVPFQLVAALAGATTVLAIVALIAWPALSAHVKTTAMVIVPWLFIWTVLATVQVIFLSVWHGMKRADLLQAVGRAEQALRRRKSSRGAATRRSSDRDR